MSDIGAPVAFELIRRAPSQQTAGLICEITGYRETALGRFCQREAAPLRLPLIISLGTPFLIALGRDPNAADRQRSFAAGLNIGAVHIESDGGAECVQVDFTPLGAYRFFGGAVVDLAAPDRHRRRARPRRPAVARAPGSHALLAAPLRSARGLRRKARQPSALPRNRLCLSPAGAQRRRRPDRRFGRGDRLEPQAPRRSLSIRTRSRAEVCRAPDAFPSSLPLGPGRHKAGPGSRPRPDMPIKPIWPVNSSHWPASRRRPGHGAWR